VDSAFITVEPYIFGTGLPLAAPLVNPVGMTLDSSERLNDQGTLLLYYKVHKPEDI
jgi:hypothetical protein